MKPLTLLGILAVIFTACLVGYIFTADTLFAEKQEDYRVGLVMELESGFDPFTLQIAEGSFMLLAAFPIHQHSRALNLIPRLLLALSNLVTLNVLVNVTIGIGDVIQSEKASARVVS